MDDTYEIAEALDGIAHQLSRIADLLESAAAPQGVAHPQERSPSSDQ